MGTKASQGLWYWLVLFACVSVTGYSLAFPPKTGSYELDVISSRSPVVIRGVELDNMEVELGEPVTFTVSFNKVRADCRALQVSRHMWNEDTNRAYLVEDTFAVRAAIAGEPERIQKLTIDVPTMPLRALDQHLMVPGRWTVRSAVVHECPSSAGIGVTRDTVYETPIFSVRDTL